MIRTIPGHHMQSVAAVDLILKDGSGVLEELSHLQFPEFGESPKIIMMIAIFAFIYAYELMLGLHVFCQTGPQRRVDCLAPPSVCHIQMESSR